MCRWLNSGSHMKKSIMHGFYDIDFSPLRSVLFFFFLPSWVMNDLIYQIMLQNQNWRHLSRKIRWLAGRLWSNQDTFLKSLRTKVVNSALPIGFVTNWVKRGTFLLIPTLLLKNKQIQCLYRQVPNCLNSQNYSPLCRIKELHWHLSELLK